MTYFGNSNGIGKNGGAAGRQNGFFGYQKAPFVDNSLARTFGDNSRSASAASRVDPSPIGMLTEMFGLQPSDLEALLTSFGSLPMKGVEIVGHVDPGSIGAKFAADILSALTTSSSSPIALLTLLMGHYNRTKQFRTRLYELGIVDAETLAHIAFCFDPTTPDGQLIEAAAAGYRYQGTLLKPMISV